MTLHVRLSRLSGLWCCYHEQRHTQANALPQRAHPCQQIVFGCDVPLSNTSFHNLGRLTRVDEKDGSVGEGVMLLGISGSFMCFVVVHTAMVMPPMMPTLSVWALKCGGTSCSCNVVMVGG
jgi:hypothetical protein